MRLFALVLLLWGPVSLAGQAPMLAIIIDDLGNDLVHGSRALALPGQVTYAILPHTPYASTLAEAAHLRGKELMLHLPMQTLDGRPTGPGGLHVDMDRKALALAVERDLASVPHAVGVNNHMGSLLTQQPTSMGWLMQALKRHPGLYYVDSRTDDRTVAEQQAQSAGLPASRRDVFLDNVRDEVAVLAQLQLAVVKAQRNGAAIAIGHPYPETLAVLARELPRLEAYGVMLMPVSALIDQQQRIKAWRASSSPSPRVAKNSKQLP